MKTDVAGFGIGAAYGIEGCGCFGQGGEGGYGDVVFLVTLPEDTYPRIALFFCFFPAAQIGGVGAGVLFHRV